MDLWDFEKKRNLPHYVWGKDWLVAFLWAQTVYWINHKGVARYVPVGLTVVYLAHSQDY